MSLLVTEVTQDHDLPRLVGEINGASWDEANDLSVYDAESLTLYLQRQDTIFIACHEQSADGQALLGIASARVELKPYDQERWLYVDEVDVAVDKRQRGAGKLMMQKLIEIARREGCEELWLGTELDNVPANALYQSLQPDEVEKFVGYAYEIDD